MAGGRVKAREGEIKRGGCVTCYSICYTELIVYRDWRRHLSKAVKLPMNYTALTPFSLAHSLPLSVHLTLAFYLPLLPFGSQPVCVTLSLVSPLSHVPVSEHYQQHGMCRRGMKCICHCFYIYALFSLPHAVLSLTVSLSLSVFPALLLCSVTPLHLMSWKTNRPFIRLW